MQLQILKTTRLKTKTLQAMELIGEAARVTAEDIHNKILEIKKNPFVRNAIFINHKMIIETNPITCKMTKTEYLIGRFVISVDLDGGDVHFSNLDVEILGKAAPHVFADGRACFGNISGDIPKLIGAYELPSVVGLLIGFLQSANDKDHEGRHVHGWPKIESGRIIKSSYTDINFINPIMSKEGTYDEYQAYCLDHPGCLE